MSWRDYYKSGFTSGFGDPRDGGRRRHRGQDISHSTQPGTVGVPALRAGRVVSKTSPSSAHGFGYGITVRSVLDDGNEWDISYSHGPWASSQQVGEQVAAGQIILHEGRSGATFGSCVHIEQKRVSSGIFIDPRPEINRVARQGEAAPAPVPAPPAPLPQSGRIGGMHDWWWLGIQMMLKRDFGYTGPLDGRADQGGGTAKRFQAFLNAKGYPQRAGVGRLVEDGLLMTKSIKGAQRWLAETGRNPGDVDGVPGARTHGAFQRAESENHAAYKKFF